VGTREAALLIFNDHGNSSKSPQSMCMHQIMHA
jgi:hypothetical protein